MRRIAILIAITAIQLQSGAAFAQASALDQARAARFAGRIDDAERLLTIALRTEPNNYLMLYNMGLVYEARAVRAPAGEQRLQHYRTAAGWLERAFRSPGRASAGADAYTIFNSLGAMYLGLGDLNRADDYLQQGLRNQNRLNNSSRGRLYGSLGYLYAVQGDARRARQFFEQGARLGNAFARENLERLDRAGIR
jgi:tetratricopeptide (TPR) repeat protein